MAGLPHYKNSKASMEMWEPVYLNLYEVLIKPPEAVSTWDFVLDNIIKVSGLDIEKVPGTVEQIFKGAPRSFTGALPDGLTADITIDFEVNMDDNASMYVYKGLREWTDLLYDPMTGARSLKVDYAGGPMIISIVNKEGKITRQVKFPTIFPSSAITPMDLDYSSGTNIYQISISFRADYWEDIAV